MASIIFMYTVVFELGPRQQGEADEVGEKSQQVQEWISEGAVSCVGTDVSTGQEGRRVKALRGRIQALDFILGLRTSH